MTRRVHDTTSNKNEVNRPQFRPGIQFSVSSFRWRCCVAVVGSADLALYTDHKPQILRAIRFDYATRINCVASESKTLKSNRGLWPIHPSCLKSNLSNYGSLSLREEIFRNTQFYACVSSKAKNKGSLSRQFL